MHVIVALERHELICEVYCPCWLMSWMPQKKLPCQFSGRAIINLKSTTKYQHIFGGTWQCQRYCICDNIDQLFLGMLPVRDALADACSIHCLRRLASPTRVCLPQESSSTITTGRCEIVASITRQRPASLM